ncbi:MAG: ABC transporter ATP-binding protein [Fimbriimonas sp.]
MPAIEARALRKVYVSNKKQPGVMGALKGLVSRERTEVEAVKGVDLRIEQGELVGFLGPNGAGKTTTLKMLSGILYPTSGEATVLGYVPSERRSEMLRQIALVMGNKQQLWWDLPAVDSFAVLRELYEVPDDLYKRRLGQLVEALDIGSKIETQVRKLSLGERMKCELVAALLHGPRVVFLDEPTLGLDVVSQKSIREFLSRLHEEEGTTMLLTSHYMQDVQELCDRVVVIDHGSVVFEGTLDALASRFSDARRVRLSFSAPVSEADVTPYGRVVERSDEFALVEVARADATKATAAMLQSLPVSDLSIESVDIEEVIRDLFTRK